MGIRVHKAIGYGITDLQVNAEYEITDPRFQGSKWDQVSESIWSIKEEEIKARLDRDLIAELYVLAGMENEMEAQVSYSMIQINLDLISRKEMRKTPLHTWDPEFGIAEVMLFHPLFTKSHRHNDTLDWIEETEFHEQRNRCHILEKPPYPYDAWSYKGKKIPFFKEGAKPYIPASVIASLVLHREAIADIEALVKDLKPIFYVYWS